MRSGSHEAEDRQGWGSNLFFHTSPPLCVCVCVGGQKGDVGGGGEVADRMLGWPGVHAGATVDNR